MKQIMTGEGLPFQLCWEWLQPQIEVYTVEHKGEVLYRADDPKGLAKLVTRINELVTQPPQDAVIQEEASD